jgi:hypothetical protein
MSNSLGTRPKYQSVHNVLSKRPSISIPGQSHVPHVHPAGLFLLVAFAVVSFLLRKTFCGWMCPIGTVGELDGLHAPQEATRILGDAINQCRLGQLTLHGAPLPSHNPPNIVELSTADVHH